MNSQADSFVVSVKSIFTIFNSMCVQAVAWSFSKPSLCTVFYSLCQCRRVVRIYIWISVYHMLNERQLVGFECQLGTCGVLHLACGGLFRSQFSIFGQMRSFLAEMCIASLSESWSKTHTHTLTSQSIEDPLESFLDHLIELLRSAFFARCNLIRWTNVIDEFHFCAGFLDFSILGFMANIVYKQSKGSRACRYMLSHSPTVA